MREAILDSLYIFGLLIIAVSFLLLIAMADHPDPDQALLAARRSIGGMVIGSFLVLIGISFKI